MPDHTDENNTVTKLHSARYWQYAAHAASTEKGWWEDCPEKDSPHYTSYIIAKVALISCEVSEAIEEVRNNQELVYYNDAKPDKPEGLAVELIDVLLRTFDMLEHLGADAEEVLALKLAYNKTRPHRHGGKAL